MALISSINFTNHSSTIGASAIQLTQASRLKYTAAGSRFPLIGAFRIHEQHLWKWRNKKSLASNGLQWNGVAAANYKSLG